MVGRCRNVSDLQDGRLGRIPATDRGRPESEVFAWFARGLIEMKRVREGGARIQHMFSVVSVCFL